MEEKREITRCKKIFKMSQDEFLQGAWLQEINKIFDYDKFDISYVSEELVVKFYKDTGVQNE
jgi:DUF438 domain-containing protein